MPRWVKTAVAAALLVALCCSCGGNQYILDPGTPSTHGAGLPTLIDLADSKSASDIALRNGADFDQSGGDAEVIDTSVMLNTSDGSAEWVLYQFDLGNLGDVSSVTLQYHGSGWVAIADYDAKRWHFAEASGSSILVTQLIGMGVSSPGQNCFVACIAGEAGEFGVHSIELEATEMEDFAMAWAMPDNGWAPLDVNLSAFGTEAASGITSLLWDIDGDGSFETDVTTQGGYTDTTFLEPGTYEIGLQATAGNGSVSRDFVEITVRDPANSTVDYDYVYDDTQVKRIDISVSQASWDLMWVEPRDEVEVSATVNVFGEQLASPVGFKMKGNSSLFSSGEKKSWKLDINKYDELQEFQNLKMLVLNNNWNDPSQCREKLAYDLMQEAGLAASSVSYVELYIDIENQGAEYWGLYSLIERLDKKFLANKIGDKTGNLYKAGGHSTLLYQGSSIENYRNSQDEYIYLMETNEDTNDGSDIVHLMDILNNTPIDELPNALEAVFDVDSFMRYYAINKLTAALDDYACVGHNYYLYNDPATEKFIWIPWDLNGAFGIFGAAQVNASAPLYDVPFAGPRDGAPMFERLMEIEKYRIHLAAYIDLARRTIATPSIVRASAKHWHDQIAPFVLNETRVDYFSYDDFDVNWQQNITVERIPGQFKAYFGVGNLVQVRANYVDEHLLADL